MSQQGQKNASVNITSVEPWVLTSISSIFVLDPSNYILIGKMSFLNEISSYN